MTRTAAFAGRLVGRVWRAVSWPLRSVWRVVVLGWLVGIGIVGSAGLAAADTGLIQGPDLAGGAAPTVFEQAPWFGYGLPAFAGGPGQGWTEKTMWGALNLITIVLNALSAVLVRGALAAMQWMLNLTLYRDNAAAMDTATQGVASAVFWPLIGCTVAAAGFTMYARARRDGHGSILGEALKVGVLGVLAVSFVLAPSKVVSPLDDARTAASDAIMTGYSSNTVAGDNPAGFPPVDIPAGPGAASRRLADSMWSTFVVTPWCYTAFGGKDLCREWGQDFITGSDKWNKVAVDIVTNDAFNEIDPGRKPDACVETFADACDSVRGLTIGRFISALVGALVSIPLAIMLLVLTIFGLMAVVGVLFLAMMAPIFVVAWMIPGLPRTVGLKWFQALIGCMIQSALIAALLGVVMVLAGILQAMIPTYGFWMVGLLNVVVMIMALRVRGMFENLTGLSHPAASGLMSSYVAMKTLGTVGRMSKRVGHASASAVGAGARGAAAGAAHGSAGYMNDGARTLQQTTAAPRGGRLRQHFSPALPMPDSARTGPVADAARQAAGPRAITTGVRATPWAPRPAGFPHSEPKVDKGARNWGGVGHPGDVPAAARMRVDPSSSDQPVRPSRHGQTIAGAPPLRQTVNASPRQHDPLVITRHPRPVTPRAQLSGPRPVRPPQASTPRPARELLPAPLKGRKS